MPTTLRCSRTARPAPACAGASTASARPAPARCASRVAPSRRRLSSAAPSTPAGRRTLAPPAAAAAAEAEDVDIEGETAEKMDKALDAARRSFASVRTGRATPALVDRVVVDYFGAPTPLNALAGVSAPDAGTVLIQPYDQSSIAVIEKAIVASDLGITPANDGRVIRLNVPPLTADRRKEMGKTVSKLGEEGKVAVRNVRKASMKAVDALLKAGSVSEDAHKALSKAVQDLTDAHVKEVDELVKKKQAELAKV